MGRSGIGLRVGPAASAESLHVGGGYGEGCLDLEPEPVPEAGRYMGGKAGNSAEFLIQGRSPFNKPTPR